MHRISILIVDDNPKTCRLVEEALIFEGWEANSVYSGEEALESVAKSLPDAIVLDLMLPGIDGIETFHKIKSIAPVPVLILSAKGAIEDKVICLNMGADDYLSKPFDIRELVARISKIIEHHIPATPQHTFTKNGLR